MDQNNRNRVAPWSFKPEVYQFIVDTLKKHRVMAWTRLEDKSKKKTDKLLVDALHCLQQGGPVENITGANNLLYLLKLALIYSGHYEVREVAGKKKTVKEIYYIIPNQLRQGRFKEDIKNAIAKYAEKIKSKTDRSGKLSLNPMYPVVFEDSQETHYYYNNAMNNEIDAHIQKAQEVVDNPPRNRNYIGRDYRPSEQLLMYIPTDVLQWQFEQGNTKDIFIDVNRLTKKQLPWLMGKAYTDRDTESPIPPNFEDLVAEDKKILGATWYVTAKTARGSTSYDLNIPQSIFQRMTRMLQTLSLLKETGSDYVVPNMVAGLMTSDDDTARSLLRTALKEQEP